MRNLLLALSATFFLITGCIEYTSNEDKVRVVHLWVSSETEMMRWESADVEVMIVKEGNRQYRIGVRAITGFNYEKGYEYSLRVKKTTTKNIIDRLEGNDFYELTEILSKVPKQSPKNM